MSSHIVIVENRQDWRADFPEVDLVEAGDYLGNKNYLQLKQPHVINLCRSYRYLSTGYYCSLLAEARRHRMLPSVRTITDLSRKAIYSLDSEGLDKLVDRYLKKHTGQLERNTFDMYILFGRTESPEFQPLARQIFESFACPLLKIEFRHQQGWHISRIKPIGLNALPEELNDFFNEAFNSYLSYRWRKPKPRSRYRYDLAILHNPDERLPPSNKAALQKFVRAGKKLAINVELIGKKDYNRLAEYDALFIRETTNIDHYTYQFARKAEAEGMVVMDDPHSIVMCTNKVYLSELLEKNAIPRPCSVILHKGNNSESGIDYPVVLKIPDGSFSRGVFKAENAEQYASITKELFRDSDLLLAQEYLYTEFDWRIGVLNRQPIFACQYYMSRSHWQIVKHGSKGGFTEGGYQSWPLSSVAPEVIETAVRAANL
ncbi:MAG: RimK family protein, partial [Thiohalophilus sp.]